MKISDLVRELERSIGKYGDIEVMVEFDDVFYGPRLEFKDHLVSWDEYGEPVQIAITDRLVIK